MKSNSKPLPWVAFSILLALSLKPRHGYEIIKQIEQDSAGKIKLGPGALYTSIKHLREQDLIEEIGLQNDTNRRYYQLTKRGTAQLQSEVEYYQAAVTLAQQRQIFAGGLQDA